MPEILAMIQPDILLRHNLQPVFVRVIECLFYGGGGGGVFPKVDSAASQQMRFKLPACACNVSRHTTSLVSAESARDCSVITAILMMIK